MSEFNPYAPPETSTESPAGSDAAPVGDCFRDGRWLVLRKGADFPARCVRCNAPAGRERIAQKFEHFHFWWPMIQRVRVAVPLCPRHLARHHRIIAVAGLGALLGINLFLASVGIRLAAGVPGGLLLFVVGIAVVNSQMQVVRAHRIRTHFVWLRRVCPAFLADLPRWCPRV